MITSDTFQTSLWMSTAVPPPETKTLTENLNTQVVVVGAGFTGLSAALHLRELGYEVVVLEAKEIGFGASGRNGGQVNPGLKVSPDQLTKKFGKENSLEIFKATEQSADFVFDLVKKYSLNCELDRTGFLYASESKTMLARTHSRFAWLKKQGINVEMLDAKETANRVGHNIYRGSLFDPRGGALQPLSYVRELGSVVLSNGGKIFTDSPVTSVKRYNKIWRVTTSEGYVDTQNVLFCTNAYSDMLEGVNLWPKLAQSIVPLYSFQVATKPLSDNLRKTILPAGHTVSNTRRLMLYYRFDKQGRFMIGGRGSGEDRQDVSGFKHLISKVGELFPSLKNHKIDFFWGGRVAITTDSLPHIHNPEIGIFAGLGLNGRGVAMGTLLGKWIALAVAGSLPREALPLSDIKPIPFHRWRATGVSIVTQFKAIQDKLKI